MKITLGCDPELVCTVDGAFVDASDYFSQYAPMGTDGCSSIAEIRPGYSESPVDLTAKIWKILGKAYEKYPELDYYAGHYHFGYAIGGHIHFGALDPVNLKILKHIAINDIVKNLDVVFTTLGLVLDDAEQRANRIRCGYGGSTAFRTQSHGFEYRSPGSWLLSPAMTLITLSLAKVIAVNTIEHKLNFKELKSGRHNRIYLRKIGDIVKEIPKDCYEGIDELTQLTDREIDWEVPILQNWGIG